jgi:hypothetical protein
MLLASYKAIRPGPQGIANRLIRWRLDGIYSHNEVVFEPGDGVEDLMPDGRCEPDASGALWCASSVAWERLPATSPRRPGRRGGVRFKRIKLDPAHWDLVKYHRDPLAAAEHFTRLEGSLYDWQLILGFVAWSFRHKASRNTCHEVCAEAGGQREGWRMDPCSLHESIAAEERYRTSLLWLAAGGEEAIY